jgi:site-specific DNA-methyltransferase (adenine-specific)
MTDKYTLYLGDCLEYLKTMPDKSVDAVITDPPYPDYYVELYKQTPIDFLLSINCRQLIFWSKSEDFPLDYSAVHIWNKNPSNHGAQYERIFERNGGKHYKVFTYYMINSWLAASWQHDIFTEHPSQKPIGLIRKLVEDFTHKGDTIFDPFMGSGTTGVACMQLGRNFIGCEIDEGYFGIAEKRIKQAAAQEVLFTI